MAETVLLCHGALFHFLNLQTNQKALSMQQVSIVEKHKHTLINLTLKVPLYKTK